MGKNFDFNFTPDFGGGTAVIQDAYLVVQYSPSSALRAGKFKPPIGLEHLQSDRDLAFIERAFPSSLEPNRDVGSNSTATWRGGSSPMPPASSTALPTARAWTPTRTTARTSSDVSCSLRSRPASPRSRGWAWASRDRQESRRARCPRTGREGGQHFFTLTGVTSDGTRTR